MNYNKVLFVGTGGGNDIYSTLLAVMSLHERGWRWNSCDIAGVLSPFQTHSTTPTAVPNVVKVNPSSQRKLVLRTGETLDLGFVDARVSEILPFLPPEYNVQQVLGLELHKGTHGLSRSIQELAKEYDHFVLVDIGGDILYSGTVNTHILSPMFDACCLAAFTQANVPCTLFEAGPGTDGEIDAPILEHLLAAYNAITTPLNPDIVEQWHNIFLHWLAFTRTGRTVPMTYACFKSDQTSTVMDYRARNSFLNERHYAVFEHTISNALCKNYYLIDPYEINNPFAVTCSDPMDWFYKTQIKQHFTNNEANCQFWRRQVAGKSQLVFFLTPSPLLDPDSQSKIFESCFTRAVDEKLCDLIVTTPTWWSNKPSSKGIFKMEGGWLTYAVK